MLTKTSAQIGGFKATVFLDIDTNEYFYSLTSIGELIHKPHSSPAEFLKSRAFKAIQGEAFTPTEFSDSTGARYTLP